MQKRFFRKLGLCLIIYMLTACGISRHYPKSDHYDGNKFFVPDGPGVKSIWEVMRWQLMGDRVPWPSNIKNNNYRLLTPKRDQSVITFINHATFLIQIHRITILTDPIFSQRAGPFKSFGPYQRVRAPGIELEKLPNIDVVVISHNHYDHLDLESLKKINKKFDPIFLVPLGNELLLKKEGIDKVIEMDWWDEKKIKDVLIVFTPVQHWSGRGLFDKNESLWGGYFIQSPRLKIYFAGDTGYSPYFVETKNRLGAPDVALLPIGAYEPRWFMKDQHMNPAESVQAHLDLSSSLSFGMHFGTFQLTDEAYGRPQEDLEKALKGNGINPAKFRVLDFGESYLLGD